jgi:hypothetical protein
VVLLADAENMLRRPRGGADEPLEIVVEEIRRQGRPVDDNGEPDEQQPRRDPEPAAVDLWLTR